MMSVQQIYLFGKILQGIELGYIHSLPLDLHVYNDVYFGVLKAFLSYNTKLAPFPLRNSHNFFSCKIQSKR